MNIRLKKVLIAVLCVVVSLGVYLYLCMIVIPKDVNECK